MINVAFAKVKDVPFILRGTKEICTIEKQKPELENKQLKLIRSAIQNKEIRVASADGKAVGFVQFKFTKKNPYGINYGNYERKFCWIEWMYVLNEWRRKGIATLLHKDVISLCKKNNVKEIMLDVFQVNSVARKFYRREGFSEFIRILKERID
ncbi:GNAT family N-acetyltransferase [Candidatus Woesearchaeota archaeon]|nr:GNAT family N-acetyltransferase [Candidatus Woesearchaeota archaeon]MBW3022436.1 GNAT family N-acetyltransferase [Candidatus Woesearchaeota archaeon]